MGQILPCSGCSKQQEDEYSNITCISQTHIHNVLIQITDYPLSNSKSEALVLDSRVETEENCQILKPPTCDDLVFITNAGKVLNYPKYCKYPFKKIFHIYWQTKKQAKTSNIERSEPFLMVAQCLQYADNLRLNSICFTDLFDNNSTYNKQQFTQIILLAIKYLLQQKYEYLLSIEFNLKYSIQEFKSIYVKVFQKNLNDNPSSEFAQLDQDITQSVYSSKIANPKVNVRCSI